MKSAWVLLALGASACAEPVIELSLRLPTESEGANFNTACTTAIEVIATGNSYPGDPNDFKRDCIQVSGAATFASVKNEMAGQFDLRIPDTGLAGVDIFGRTGDCSIPVDSYDRDLVFYGGSKYTGGERMAIGLTGNLSCERTAVTVHPIDMMKLITTKDCVMAKLVDEPNSYGSTGTFSPDIDLDAVWSGGYDGNTLTNGVATFQGFTTVGSKACLGVTAGNDALDSLSCTLDGLKACATGTELEAAVINYNMAGASLDQTKMAQWNGALFGAAWANTPTKGAVSGATVAVHPDLGEVVYVEPNAAGTVLVPTGGTATGPSGLFIVYTSQLIEITVADRAGTSRTVKVAATSDEPATALVVLK
jgi:hypothetical protein